MSKVTGIKWETIPQNRSGMMERFVCNVRTKGERKATKGYSLREEDRVERCEGIEKREQWKEG